jgi:membrane-associated HD superfamily phosphohydrolase
MWKLPSFWFLLFTTVLSWGSWFVVINNLSPHESIELAFTSFYLSIFLASSFTAAIFLSLIWKIFIPTSSSHSCLKKALREGIFIGISSCIFLLFMKKATLSWEEVTLISSFFFLLEVLILKISKN